MCLAEAMSKMPGQQSSWLTNISIKSSKSAKSGCCPKLQDIRSWGPQCLLSMGLGWEGHGQLRGSVLLPGSLVFSMDAPSESCFLRAVSYRLIVASREEGLLSLCPDAGSILSSGLCPAVITFLLS